MSKQHRVRAGECMNSIAFRYGFIPETLWLHADNKALREARRADNVLLAGDIVNVPDLDRRTESKATDAEHVFKRNGVPAVLRIKFVRRIEPEDDGDDAGGVMEASVYEDPRPSAQEPQYEALADAPYEIRGDVSDTGTSDAEGMVDVPIQPDAMRATIIFHRGTEDEISFDLALGSLDPVDTPAGLSQRLCNLGYACPPGAATLDEEVRAALRNFQRDNDIDPTGASDRSTQDKLVEVHGS